MTLLTRKQQREDAGRVPDRPLVLGRRGRSFLDRGVEEGLHPGEAAQFPGNSDAERTRRGVQHPNMPAGTGILSWRQRAEQVTMKHSLVNRLVVLPLLIFGWPSMAFGAETPPDSLTASIMFFASGRPIDQVPYRQIAQFGPKAAPVIRKLLADRRHDSLTPQLVTMLGLLGDESDTPRLINVVTKRYNGKLTRDQMGAVISAIFALGYLSDHDLNALEFLRQHADPGSFTKLHYSIEYQSESELPLFLSRLAISGIGLSARPEAGALLDHLAQHPYTPAQLDNIHNAIRTHAAIMKVGREHYGEELRREKGETGVRK